jgi:hypothetical protein
VLARFISRESHVRSGWRPIAARDVQFDSTLDQAQLTAAMTRLDQIREQLLPAEQQRIVRLLSRR